MNRSIVKSVLGGIFLGALIFFTGPLLLIILILKFIFTPFGMGRMMMAGRMGYHHMPPFAYASKIRNMSEEEYSAFETKMKNRFHGHCHSRNETKN
jgi:hypothetical protein